MREISEIILHISIILPYQLDNCWKSSDLKAITHFEWEEIKKVNWSFWLSGVFFFCSQLNAGFRKHNIFVCKDGNCVILGDYTVIHRCPYLTMERERLYVGTNHSLMHIFHYVHEVIGEEWLRTREQEYKHIMASKAVWQYDTGRVVFESKNDLSSVSQFHFSPHQQHHFSVHLLAWKGKKILTR